MMPGNGRPGTRMVRPGNHQYHTGGAAGYFGYFGAAAGQRGQGWYSFEAGTWHVVVLNTNCDVVRCAAGSAQDRWLRADLAASAARGGRDDARGVRQFVVGTGGNGHYPFGRTAARSQVRHTGTYGALRRVPLSADPHVLSVATPSVPQ